jgi:hypothetical protein
MFALSESAALRLRAHNLRSLAAQILQSPVMDLLPHADLTTWNSPRAEACRARLATQIAAARQAADELHLVAQRLDQQAHEMELAAIAAATALNSQLHNLGPEEFK